MCKIIGIDISKQTFDVCFRQGNKLKHHVFDNKLVGFKSLKKLLTTEDIDIMEASGPYYVQLANFLHNKSIRVSVVNPLAIKRYSQMQFYRAKTDKKDASIIMEYGELQKETLPLWNPVSKTIGSLKQLHSCLELLIKQKYQVQRQLEAFTTTGYIDLEVSKTLKSMIKSLEKRIDKLEQQMLLICKRDYEKTFDVLTSIPGIGKKTAIMLIVITNDFTKFKHYKQLIAYVGFSPRIYQSGTSVKGKGHICKMGKSQIRKLLYLCSWSAKRCNKTCVEMYQRLKAKGKPERVIKIAIANKLLKQAFAVATTKQKYVENYQTNVCF